MNWFLFALLCLLGWGLADLFYKKGTDETDGASHLKIAVWVGLVMGLSSAVLFALCRIPETAEFFADNVMSVASGEELTFGRFIEDIVKYSPASLCYIISMVVGYAGLRYLEVSIVSPVQNASGAFSAIAMFIFFAVTGNIGQFSEEFSFLDIIGTIIIVGGVVVLAIIENRDGISEATSTANDQKTNKKYISGALALIFPILYCVFDTAGTAADGIILSDEAGLGLGEIDILILYGLTFFLFGVGAWIFMLIHHHKAYNPFAKYERFKALAALSEEVGQIFYVYAMAARPMIAAPMIGSYCIVSVVLSRVFLKEKLSHAKYMCVLAVCVGILLLGISEGLAES